MAVSTILQKAQKEVESILSASLSPDFRYHDLNHTSSVVDYCTQFAEHYQLRDTDREVLGLAAWFHDVGYTTGYDDHEKSSAAIARDFLKRENYLPEATERVTDCILATMVDASPNNLLEQIIKDADLSNLGEEAFLQQSNNLRYEWKALLQEEYTDQQWYELNRDFLESHQYFTEAAKDRFQKQKKANYKKVKRILKELKSKKPGMDTITGNRNAQMMFKTTLRNHIDLTSIADNKANMMLSICAIVISISMPLLATNIQENAFLLYPVGTLLLTCSVTIIFATIATRPIKTTGMTHIDQINSGKTNLFFFGNFYKMSREEYQAGLRQVIKDDKILDSAIINDLYYLGTALGKKYNMLRTCYAVFMIGIMLTVVAFVVSFLSLAG